MLTLRWLVALALCASTAVAFEAKQLERRAPEKEEEEASAAFWTIAPGAPNAGGGSNVHDAHQVAAALRLWSPCDACHLEARTSEAALRCVTTACRSGASTLVGDLDLGVKSCYHSPDGARGPPFRARHRFATAWPAAPRNHNGSLPVGTNRSELSAGAEALAAHLERTDRVALFVGDSVTNQLADFLRHSLRHRPGAKSSRILAYRHDAQNGRQNVTAALAKWRAYAQNAKGGVLLVVNIGLHVGHSDAYARALRELLGAMETFAGSGQTRGTKARHVAVFLETSVQHFATVDGMFAERQSRQALSQNAKTLPPQNHAPDAPATDRDDPFPEALPYAPRYPCRPLRDGAAGSWYNAALKAAMPAFPRVAVVSMEALTRQLWDAHVGDVVLASGAARKVYTDCTHFCYAPALVEVFAAELLRADSKGTSRWT